MFLLNLVYKRAVGMGSLSGDAMTVRGVEPRDVKITESLLIVGPGSTCRRRPVAKC